MNLEPVLEECGLSMATVAAVHGGDINHCYSLQNKSGKYFLKINDATRYPLMFAYEAEGLNMLRENSTLYIPAVLKYGAIAGHQYLLLEWIDNGKPSIGFWEEFGRGLAMQHKKEQKFFGWSHANYIGSLVQENAETADWPEFYANQRILPLAEQLHQNKAFESADMKNARSLCDRLASIFPSENPSLLHGDLWSGNFMANEAGRPALYDPAVYYGNREMEIGMTYLFGGFDQRFYDSYNEIFPLEKGWKQRISLTQLYPLLVHSILFGGSYVQKSRQILAQFSR